MERLHLCLAGLLVFSANLNFNPTDAARILAVFSAPSKSHVVFFQSLTNELADRGHELVVMTVHPQRISRKNYTEIHLNDGYGLKQMFDLASFERGRSVLVRPFLETYMVWGMGNALCELQLGEPAVQQFMHSGTNFDLIITELFFSECFLGFAHVFSAPVVVMSSLAPPFWIDNLVANPNMYSFNPNFVLPFTERMNFWQRLANTAFSIAMEVTRKYYFMPQQNEIARRFFGNTLPPLETLRRNTSLVLVNTHYSTNYPRPLVPSMVEVGGMHIKSPKKLPMDLQQFLDGATDGVIYFSLGSILRSDRVPDEKRQAFLQAFRELSQKVLWKFESEDLPNQPKNVKISKWIPQNDVLAHPNVKVFITHGGQLSVQEANYHAVPLLGIPFFSDQFRNIKKAESAGCAVHLGFEQITKQTVLEGLRRLINNPEYKRNAVKRSNLMKDQPDQPLSRAVFWTEYVIRHKGAHHLKSAALDLTWYQYFLLDVLALVLSVLALLSYILYRVGKKAWSVFSKAFANKMKLE